MVCASRSYENIRRCYRPCAGTKVPFALGLHQEHCRSKSTAGESAEALSPAAGRCRNVAGTLSATLAKGHSAEASSARFR